MTKDTLTLVSTDLLAIAETVDVTVKGPPSERYEHSYGKSSYPAHQWAQKMVELSLPITDDQVDEQFVYQSVPDLTVRPEHHDLISSEPYQHSYTYDYLSLSRTVVIPNCRCSVINIKDLIKRALRTYPKRMSRAKRKEARAREQRRRIKDNQWWSKR